MKITCYFDGACEPYNPGGNMGIGACIEIPNQPDIEYTKAFPKDPMNSNNVAEYLAFEQVLYSLLQDGFQDEDVTICGDSKIVVQQMNGEWHIKKGMYKEHALRCKQMVDKFSSLTIKWIPREQNEKADMLSKKSLTAT